MVQLRDRSERVPVTYHIGMPADVQVCSSRIGSVKLILNSFFHTRDGTMGAKWSLYETPVRSANDLTTSERIYAGGFGERH